MNNIYYQNKYKIHTVRLDRDYSLPNHYFITICTNKRKMFFGSIKEGQIYLNQIGQSAVKMWLEIPKKFNNVILDEFIIMPNHIHGIIEIISYNCRDAPRRVSTPYVPLNKFGPLKKNSLSSIINHFKGNVKRWCNKNGFDYFLWQPLFYDHVIRNYDSLENIRNYIINNPYNWERDRNNPKNI